jgi:hypothetical protein
MWNEGFEAGDLLSTGRHGQETGRNRRRETG